MSSADLISPEEAFWFKTPSIETYCKTKPLREEHRRNNTINSGRFVSPFKTKPSIRFHVLMDLKYKTKSI